MLPLVFDLLPLTDYGDIAAFLRKEEGTGVFSDPRRDEIDLLLGAGWRDHRGDGAVSGVAFGRVGRDGGDDALVALADDGHASRAGCVGGGKYPGDHVRDDLPAVFGRQERRGPLAVEVGGVGDDLAESVLPGGQDGLAVGRLKDGVGQTFCLGENIAVCTRLKNF